MAPVALRGPRVIKFSRDCLCGHTYCNILQVSSAICLLTSNRHLCTCDLCTIDLPSDYGIPCVSHSADTMVVSRKKDRQRGRRSESSRESARKEPIMLPHATDGPSRVCGSIPTEFFAAGGGVELNQSVYF